MKNNEQIQQDVEDAIKWEPLLHAAEIGVTVKDGVVTLMGTVDNYLKRIEAEKAAKKVEGVKAVVEKIEVRLPHAAGKTDQEIAEQLLSAFKNNWSIPDLKVKIKVENGWVYLDGTFSWDYQREAVKRVLYYIQGVKGVINNITIESEVHDELEEKLIKNALKRHWSINGDTITVDVSGTTVTLAGFVTSLYQKEEAGRITWKTPGVWSVINNLKVEYEHAFQKNKDRM
ncbi:BON domain-containing protein [Flavobacterium sp.]|uniref:BON domain-containing protein n=1 Tax=Flavobacterium sp. TaxID=239 RepID=UPI003D6A82F8